MTEYVTKALSTVNGMKALLLDEQTVRAHATMPTHARAQTEAMMRAPILVDCTLTDGFMRVAVSLHDITLHCWCSSGVDGGVGHLSE
jgi:hypothetical protein